MQYNNGYLLGLFFLLLVGLIWAGASVLMQHIYDDMDFRSPFFLTFLTNSLLVIYLPLWQVWLLVGAFEKPASHQRIPSGDNDLDSPHLQQKLNPNHLSEDQYSPLPSFAATPTNADTDNNISCKSNSEEVALEYTHMDVIRVALVIAPLYVLSNGLYNYSLFMTSVSSSTIISNLSGIFTFAFSWYLGLEGFTYGKIFGVLACFLGAVCVGVSDSEQSGPEGSGEHTVAGDSVALTGAVFYGLYTTTLKYMIPDDNGISMQLLLGYVGLINVVVLAPVLAILFLSGAEHFKHLTWTVFGYMCISGLFNNVISDYLWARSVVLTSSTVATVGLSITIPLAMVSDLLVHNEAPTALSGLGATLVIVGFCLVNLTREAEIDIFMYLCGGLYDRMWPEDRMLKDLVKPRPGRGGEVELDDMVVI